MKMEVYKTCCDGNWCAHVELEEAKRMFISDIEDAERITDEEYYRYIGIVEGLDDRMLFVEHFKVGEFTLMIDEMSEEEFNNLGEFEGY